MFGFGTPAAAPAPATPGFGGGFGGGFKGFGSPAPAPASTPGAGALTTWGGTAGATTAASAGGAPAPEESNVLVSGETSFAQLPQAIQQKIFEVHRLIVEHRRHSEGVSRFSTQDYGLEQQTKKLKLDMLRVQNAHAELAGAAGELRRQVERLRGYIQKLQAAESGLPQYGRGGAKPWQQHQQQQPSDGHAEILREVVGQFEARLAQYDAHIEDLYRKVVSAHGGGRGGERGAASPTAGQVFPDQLAGLIRLQNDALLKVAAQVAGVHEMVERMRSEWTSRAGQDPFEELDRLAQEEEERKRKAARLVVPSTSLISAAPSGQGIFPMGRGGTGAHAGGALGLAGAATSMGGGCGGGLFGRQANVAGTPQQAGGAFGATSAFGPETMGFWGQSDTGSARRQKRNVGRR